MKMKTFLRGVCAAALAVGLATPVFAEELKVTMNDGRVTIIADNVPLRQILLEWARVGQAKIVNADKMNGPSITLQLINTPERDALDILLRSASGYIAAPRAVALANAAIFDRVTIMPTSRPPAVSASNMPPTFQRPPAPVEENDEPINVTMPPQPQGNPVNGQFPGMAPMGGVPPMPTQPGPPLTSPRPGAVQAPAAQPGPPNPYQPIVRPPGPIAPGGRGGGPGGQ